MYDGASGFTGPSVIGTSLSFSFTSTFITLQTNIPTDLAYQLVYEGGSSTTQPALSTAGSGYTARTTVASPSYVDGAGLYAGTKVATVTISFTGYGDDTDRTARIFWFGDADALVAYSEPISIKVSCENST